MATKLAPSTQLDVVLNQKKTYWKGSTPLGHFLDTGKSAMAIAGYKNSFSKKFWKKGAAGTSSNKKVVLLVRNNQLISAQINGKKVK